MTVENRSASNRHLKWSLILPLAVIGIPVVALIWNGSFGSTAAAFHIERFRNELSNFYFQFSMWFPRISRRYVLTPGLLELLFSIPLAGFLHREFVRHETEPLFDRSHQRPERFRWIIQFGMILTAVVFLFVLGTFLSIVYGPGGVEHDGAVGETIQARSERAMTFMLLIVVNPMIYQLTVGLCLAVFCKRFLSILIPMLALGLLIYAVILTTCYCLFDIGPYRSLIFWNFGKIRIFYNERPPEVALWVTGIVGTGLMWLSIWPTRKLLTRRNQSLNKE